MNFYFDVEIFYLRFVDRKVSHLRLFYFKFLLLWKAFLLDALVDCYALICGFGLILD